MVSSATRSEVWQSLLDAARYHRYFVLLEKRYSVRHMAMRIALALAAVAGALPLIKGLPPIPPVVTGLASLAVIALVILESILGYGRRAAILHVIVQQMGKLEEGHRRLWVNVENGEGQDAETLDNLMNLKERARDVTETLHERVDKGLSKRSQEETFEAEAKRYATA